MIRQLRQFDGKSKNSDAKKQIVKEVIEISDREYSDSCEEIL